jgi:hypothetical protein
MIIGENNKLLVDQDEYDFCYDTGEYSDQDCSMCPYAEECSGSEV